MLNSDKTALKNQLKKGSDSQDDALQWMEKMQEHKEKRANAVVLQQVRQQRKNHPSAQVTAKLQERERGVTFKVLTGLQVIG